MGSSVLCHLIEGGESYRVDALPTTLLGADGRSVVALRRSPAVRALSAHEREDLWLAGMASRRESLTNPRAAAAKCAKRLRKR